MHRAENLEEYVISLPEMGQKSVSGSNTLFLTFPVILKETAKECHLLGLPHNDDT